MKTIRSLTGAFTALFLLAAAAAGGELRLGTLNTYLCFSPAVAHGGQLEEQARLSPAEYEKKISNLSAMAAHFDVVGLQEVGGRTEVEDIAQKLGFQYAFAKGRDTYTGEEVGIVWRPVPGWRVVRNGRVAELDAIVSKHIVVTFHSGDGRKVVVMDCHLLRPIGQNQTKHARQIQAINDWASSVIAGDSRTTVVVLGDTNDATPRPIFLFGREANQLNGYAATHLTGKAFDRIAAAGSGTLRDPEVFLPPYGSRRPSNLVLRLSTDHFAFGAVLVLP